MNVGKNLSMVSIISIGDFIEKLRKLNESSIAIDELCRSYSKRLRNGEHDTMLCESFLSDLSKVALSDGAKSVMKELKESIDDNSINIKLANCIYRMAGTPCSYVAPVLESELVEYMSDKCKETRDGFRVSASLFENSSEVKEILDTLVYEEYIESTGSVKNAELKESDVKQEKLYTEEEVKSMLKNKIDESSSKKEKFHGNVNDIDSHVNLCGTIDNIMRKSSNEKLLSFCESFVDRLNNGVPEELLYEEFISGASRWNYINSVETELESMVERVNRYKQDIDLKKILRIMEQTGSYYIVPLIEECVVDYVNNKNMTNRVLLKQRLMSFESDPFVRDILNVITNDMSVGNTVYLGESIESLNGYVHTENVYSPIYSVNENECVFNVKGDYYKKNGSSISKLSRNEVSTLPDSFKNLCRIVNEACIEFSNGENSASLCGSEDFAVITESSITINGNRVTTGELESMSKLSYMRLENKQQFYSDVKTLNENFNDIAYIDFVKRVSSNDNSGRSVDVFKINENMYVTTVDESMGHRTIFYRNVNPIQCRNYINEHMEINVAPLFEDELPNQDSIEKKIKEKSKEYEDYIDMLEQKKKDFEAMKDESDSSDDIDAAIAAIDSELSDAKADYKKYQEDSEKFMKGDPSDSEDSLKKEVDADGDDEETPADKIPDDEKESPEEMEVPIEDTGTSDEKKFKLPDVDDYDGIDLEDAVDYEEEMDGFSDVKAFDPDFDVPAEKTNYESEDGDRFQVVKVSYSRNVKTGESSSKGEVIVIIPSVDGNGSIHDEMRKVTFYLDGDRTPIINNEYMPLDMYMAIKSAIENCPETDTVSLSGDGDSTSSEDDLMDVLYKPKYSDSDDETSSFNIDDYIGDSSNDSSTGNVVQQSPAEVEKIDDLSAKYPTTVGVYPDEIKPIKMEDFEKSLDEMCIKHSKSESADGEVCMTLENKAQVMALYNHFRDWLNYSLDNFVNFFPELKNCVSCNSQPELMEGVFVKSVRPMMESARSSVKVVLPSNNEYCRAFGLTENVNGHIELLLFNDKDIQNVYESLSDIKKSGIDLCQDAEDFIERFDRKCKKIYESKNSSVINLPYNGFLAQKLTGKGFDVKSINEMMSVRVFNDDIKKARKVFEGFYKKDMPDRLKSFFIDAEKSLNEGLKITVKDSNSDKTIEINVDGNVSVSSSAEGGNDGNDVEDADFESSFSNTTFDVKDSLAFSDDKDSSDEEDGKDSEKDEKDSSKSDKSSKDFGKKEEDSDEDKSDENEEEGKKPDKKKFRFKVKKHSSKNESFSLGHGRHLNESALPTVLDYVKVNGDKTGQIICELANGNFIVNVEGHTLEVPRKSVTMIHERPDAVESPFKFDEATLKGLFEQMVECGVFVNDFRITPRDCYVKYIDYIRANDDAEIPILIEGQVTTSKKSFIKITENLSEAMDLGRYAQGYQTDSNGNVVRSILVNKQDFNEYCSVKESSYPVRVLVMDDDTNETSLVNMSGDSIEIKN